jgi:hypothetical protein
LGRVERDDFRVRRFGGEWGFVDNDVAHEDGGGAVRVFGDVLL